MQKTIDSRKVSYSKPQVVELGDIAEMTKGSGPVSTALDGVYHSDTGEFDWNGGYAS